MVSCELRFWICWLVLYLHISAGQHCIFLCDCVMIRSVQRVLNRKSYECRCFNVICWSLVPVELSNLLIFLKRWWKWFSLFVCLFVLFYGFVYGSGLAVVGLQNSTMVWLRMWNNRFISISVFYAGENVILPKLLWSHGRIFFSPKRNHFGSKVILYFILAVVWNLQLFYGKYWVQCLHLVI
jgi:hypothetical protein